MFHFAGDFETFTISLIILIISTVVEAMIEERHFKKKKKAFVLKEMHLKFLFHSETVGGNYDFING